MTENAEKRINELYIKYNTITPDIVIEEAKNPESPLHDEFEWDIEKAALQTWRETARRLIRSVTISITVEKNAIVVPRYVHSPQSDKSQSYSDIAKIKSDKEKAIDLMSYEVSRMKSLIDRVRRISEVLELKKEIDSISKIINKIEMKIS